MSAPGPRAGSSGSCGSSGSSPSTMRWASPTSVPGIDPIPVAAPRGSTNSLTATPLPKPDGQEDPTTPGPAPTREVLHRPSEEPDPHARTGPERPLGPGQRRLRSSCTARRTNPTRHARTREAARDLDAPGAGQEVAVMVAEPRTTSPAGSLR